MPVEPERRLCHETLYRAPRQGAKGALSRTLAKKLRSGRALRRRRRGSSARLPRSQTSAVLIHDCPAPVELRRRVGGWAGDLVLGRGNRSAVATLVDRRTRLLRLIPLPGGHDSATLRDAITSAMEAHPETVSAPGSGRPGPATPHFWCSLGAVVRSPSLFLLCLGLPRDLLRVRCPRPLHRAICARARGRRAG